MNVFYLWRWSSTLPSGSGPVWWQWWSGLTTRRWLFCLAWWDSSDMSTQAGLHTRRWISKQVSLEYIQHPSFHRSFQHEMKTIIDRHVTLLKITDVHQSAEQLLRIEILYSFNMHRKEIFSAYRCTATDGGFLFRSSSAAAAFFTICLEIQQTDVLRGGGEKSTLKS